MSVLHNAKCTTHLNENQPRNLSVNCSISIFPDLISPVFYFSVSEEETKKTWR